MYKLFEHSGNNSGEKQYSCLEVICMVACRYHSKFAKDFAKKLFN